VLISNPSNGTFQRQTSTNNNFYEYIPTDSNFIGTESFTFKLNDGSLLSNESTITFNYSNSDNDAPSANDVTANTNEDVAVDITLNANDPDGNNLTYSIVSNPSNGSLGSVSGAGVTYTPTANWSGTDTFTYKANDGTVDSNTSTVTITVAAVNDAPTTSAVSASTDEDTAKNITLSGADVEGSSLTYSIVSDVSNGSTSLSGSTVTYTPSANFNGTDTFTYKANDGTDDSNTSTATITIAAVNDAPTAGDITLNLPFESDRSYQIDMTSVSADVDGDNLTYQMLSTDNLSDGSYSHDGSSGTGTFTSSANFTGSAGYITYRASDGSLFSHSNTTGAKIFININNSAPITTDYAVNNAVEDTNYQIDVVTTDNSATGTKIVTDAEGNSLTISIVSQGSNGTASVSGNVITYAPNANFNGTDSITYKVNDGTSDSNTSTITYTVAAVNDAPTTSAVSASTDEDTAKNITLSGADVEGSSLTYSIVSDASNGSTSLSGSTVTYTPSANFNGTDTFTYKANDGTDDSNTSTATITIAAVNDAPTTSAVSASTTANMAKDITLSGADVEGSSLTYSIVSDVSNGSTSLSGSTVTYTPSTNYSGTDTFTYKANDGTVDSNTSTVTITVNPTPRYAIPMGSNGGMIVPSFENYNDTSSDKHKSGTFAAWIYPQQIIDGNIMARRDYASNDVNGSGGCSSGCERTHFQLWLKSDGSIGFQTNNENQQGFTALTDADVITLNQWNHVVFTVDDAGCNNNNLTGTKQFYINGSAVTTTVTRPTMNGVLSTDCGTYNTGPNGLFPRDTQLSIGRVYRATTTGTSTNQSVSFSGGFDQFVGFLDELVHYDSAMSANDIATMYNSGNWFDHNDWSYEDNLYGWWSFDDQNLNNMSTNSATKWGAADYNNHEAYTSSSNGYAID
jgi:hypothetical protein